MVCSSSDMSQATRFGVFCCLLAAVAGAAALPHTKRTRDDSKKCDYCDYYEKTGLSPYELLWTVASEISPVLDEEDRTVLLMNPEDLRIAEKYFDAYCEEYCPNFKHATKGLHTKQ